LAIPAALALGLAAWVSYKGEVAAGKAQRILVETRALRPGVATAAEVDQLVQRLHGRILFGKCERGDCVAQVEAWNGRFDSLQLLPPGAFGATLYVRDHLLKRTIYEEGRGGWPWVRFPASTVVAEVTDAVCGNPSGCSSDETAKLVDQGTEPISSVVVITNLTGERKRETALQFNLRCVAFPFSCRSATDLLPGVWGPGSPWAAQEK
jgi:hypothetical protein